MWCVCVCVCACITFCWSLVELSASMFVCLWARRGGGEAGPDGRAEWPAGHFNFYNPHLLSPDGSESARLFSG